MKFMKKDCEIDQKHHQNCTWAKWRDGVIYKQRIHRVSQGMILLSRGLEPGSCCLTLTEADKSFNSMKGLRRSQFHLRKVLTTFSVLYNFTAS